MTMTAGCRIKFQFCDAISENEKKADVCQLFCGNRLYFKI